MSGTLPCYHIWDTPVVQCLVHSLGTICGTPQLHIIWCTPLIPYVGHPSCTVSGTLRRYHMWDTPVAQCQVHSLDTICGTRNNINKYISRALNPSVSNLPEVQSAVHAQLKLSKLHVQLKTGAHCLVYLLDTICGTPQLHNVWYTP